MKRSKERLLADVPPVDFYVSRRIGFNELLPWESVDSRIPRSLLEREAMRAHHGEDWVQPRAADHPLARDEELVTRGSAAAG